MTQLLVIGLMGLGGYYLVQDHSRQSTVGEQDMNQLHGQLHKDNREAGIFWGNQRVRDMNLSGLNSVHMPYSAPRQEPTYDMNDIADDQASRTAYIEAYHPGFFFRNNTEIPMTSAAAGVYNLELPSYKSVRGDPGGSMARHPRAYVIPEPSRYADSPGVVGAMGASEPEVFEEQDVPLTGQLNFEMNPYGPGGSVQRLFNNRNERITRKQACNRSTVIGPPIYRPRSFD